MVIPQQQEAEPITGASPAIHRLRTRIERIAPHFRTVLITGEPGTGKLLAARTLHRLSPGATGPFLHHHAASITPLDMAQPIRSAQGGTLYLEKIEAMPLPLQTQLLHFLEWQENQPQRLRVLSSTSADLRSLVLSRHFLPELHQRLTAIEIALPPLRERREDIPELARHLLQRAAQHQGKLVAAIAPDAMQQLQSHNWPNNIRELAETLHQAALQCQTTTLTTDDLPASTRPAQPELPASERLDDIVEAHVLRVLSRCAGNKLRTAATLGISRSTLYRILETRSFTETRAFTQPQPFAAPPKPQPNITVAAL